MTPIEIAQIERNAAQLERLQIAQGIRLLAAHGRAQALREGKRPETCDILDDLADLIERRHFSQ